MTLPVWLTLLVSFLSDFLITAGTTLTSFMVGSGQTTMPTKAGWILAGVSGLIVGARRIQALVAPSVGSSTRSLTDIKGGV